jgi:prevent-host-death family protein
MQSMTAVVPVSEARASLPELVERVQAGDEVTITRHGVPVAVLVHPASLRTRRVTTAFALAAELGKMLEEAKTRPLKLNDETTAGWVEQMVSSIRSARDAR